jgi:hypothetical protein
MRIITFTRTRHTHKTSKPYTKLSFESLKSIECVLLWRRKRRGAVEAEEEVLFRYTLLCV